MTVTPVGTEFQVNTFTNGSQADPAVAVEADVDGDFIITWRGNSPDDSGNGVFAQRYSADGTPNGSEFQVTNSSSQGAVAVDGDGDFIITWTGQDADSAGVLAQRYSADGTPDGSEFQVNTLTTNSQSDPAVAVDGDGNFIITWESYGYGQDVRENGILAQRYNADGTSNGDEFKVNTFDNVDTVTTGSQSDPAVAVDGNGNFIITWSNPAGQDGDLSGVFAQRYNADGTPNGSEFQVNTFTTGEQFNSAVAIDGDGNFIITWDSYGGQDGDSTGVFAQRYNADGSPNGSEFQVNTFTTGFQGEPDVAVDRDGDFIITWTSDGQDGDALGIFAQYYNADGSPNGSEFQVNTFTTDSQAGSAVAVDESGDFVITWSGIGQGGDNYGDVFAQRYRVDRVTGLNLEGGNGKDTLTGGEGDDTISGGNGKDELFGLAGDDIISGDNGSDLLNGGLGNDTLTGGNGPDIFVLAAGEGTDTITDFSNPDSIGLSVGIGFDDLSFSGEDIILTSTSEVLAIVTGVDTTTLDSSDFTTV